jgi:geranylgeranyl reductase family protein
LILTPKKFDVAIIGAGPAGSSAAIALSRRGYAVALLDKEHFPRDKLCGDFINPSNWPLLEEFDVKREMLSHDHEKVTAFRITSFNGAEAEVALPSSDSATAYGLGMRRFYFDQILLSRASAEGAVSLQGCRIKRLDHHADGWRIEFSRGGNLEQLEAKLLLGADGRNSWVSRHLGMTRAPLGEARAVGFQLRLNYPPGLAGRVEIHLFPGGYAGLLGLGDGTIKLGFAADKRCVGGGAGVDSLLESHLPRNPYLKTILQRSEPVGAPSSTYPVYFRPNRSIGDGVVLIGDAARVNEPVTGEGIYFAMKSGALAAQTIHDCFRCGDLSAARLADYQYRCQSEFRRRRGLNRLIRFFMYRPALLSPLIRLSASRERMLQTLVRAICTPEPAA